MNNTAKLCFFHLKFSVKQSTLYSYINVYNNCIKPYLGERDIESINSRDIDALYHTLSAGKALSPQTLCLATTVLIHILKYAKTMGLRVMDPDSVKRPKTKRPNIEILSDDEHRKLVSYCLDNPGTTTLGILVTLFTGLRIGELCALQWKDIDASNGMLSISKTVLRVAKADHIIGPKTKLYIDTPKSIASNRCIPIPSCISRYVETERKPDDVFIVNGKNRFTDPRCFRAKYYRVLKNARIDHYSYHALRHTFATKCVALGFDPKTLSEILGHSDVSITFNTYVHPSLEAMKRDMGKFTLN